jgi:acylaminoacyl-peptidase
MRVANRWLLGIVLALLSSSAFSQTKQKLTLEEFFNYVEITDVKLSPRGDAVVVSTSRADWAQERFRDDLWLIRVGETPILLAGSGENSKAKWSPDGRWIAFLSDRKLPWTKDDEQGEDKTKTVTHLYAISVNGGEAIPVTRGEESVHSFAWSQDSQSLYFSTHEPWSKARRDAYKKEWKDVLRYREADRGDVIARIAIADAVKRAEAVTPFKEDETDSPLTDNKEKKDEKKDKDKETAETPGTTILAHVGLGVDDLVLSHDGKRLAFVTFPPHRREEGVKDTELFLLNAAGGQPQQLTHNEALEANLQWSADDRQLFFGSDTGGVDGKYERIQNRIYGVDVASGKSERWARDFPGALSRFEIGGDGAVVIAGQMGVEQQLYTTKSATGPLKATAGWAGTYEKIALAEQSPRVAFLYSAWGKPGEVYIAESLSDLAHARPITSFNKQFVDHDLPQGRAYQWKADDGASVEGVLIYPPGKFGAKNLPTLTLIHGGPEDADGDSFHADWYDWAVLAATRGWLVFRPNYRGSTGYGDKFELQIAPQIVSRPGKDILEGIDALVKDGTADPNHLTVGGYSYGGYMTNWLITQTTRFKAAVTGAGAVEHIANWGNDDLSFDDAWYLGGTPWEAAKNYNSEAAIFQINKVKTPTHIVGGSVDIRVYIGEQYLLERALENLNVPHTLLVFPDEGHGLSENPWHGRIKVREELNWLDKYCPIDSVASSAAK